MPITADRPLGGGSNGDIYAGLYCPIAVAAVAFIVGTLLLKDTHSVLIWKETRPRGRGD
jgi:hypothetical protein